MSVADDYGRVDGDCRLIRSSIFPKRPERVSLDQIESWIEECSEVLPSEEDPLIRVYFVGRKRYLELTNFGQRIRGDSKFPAPSGDTRERIVRSDDRTVQSDARTVRSPAARASTPSPSPPPTTTSSPTPTPAADDGEPAERRADPESREAFDELVEAYPPAGRERLEKARESLRHALSVECKVHGLSRADVLQQIREGLERWKHSERWQAGKVHLLHNWLRERLWREYPVAATDAPKSRGKPSKSERGMADFRRRMAEEMEEQGAGSARFIHGT